MKARKQPVEVEFLTFDEVVELGKNQQDVNRSNGVPWTININGTHLTHDTDECYLGMFKGNPGRFTTDDVLVIGSEGIYPCKKESFLSVWEPMGFKGQMFEWENSITKRFARDVPETPKNKLIQERDNLEKELDSLRKVMAHGKLKHSSQILAAYPRELTLLLNQESAMCTYLRCLNERITL